MNSLQGFAKRVRSMDFIHTVVILGAAIAVLLHDLTRTILVDIGKI